MHYPVSYYKNEFDRLVISNSANSCTWDETYGSIPNLSDQDSIYVDEIVDKIINKAVLIDENGKIYNGFAEEDPYILEKGYYGKYAYFLKFNDSDSSMYLGAFMYEDYSGIFVVDEKISFPVRNENNDDIYIKVKKLTVGHEVMFEKE